jgi:hypothetical protein
MVGIGGVADAEKDGDQHDHAEHGAVAELGELLVKTEHGASPDTWGTGR